MLSDTYVKTIEIDVFIQVILIPIQQNIAMFHLLFLALHNSWQHTIDTQELTFLTGECESLEL